MIRDDFCALILTHRRPDKVVTYNTLRRQGYTGPIFLVVDDEDPSVKEYEAKFPGEVVLFSKQEVAGAASFDTDEMDNFADYRTVFYARNACPGIVRRLGFRYWIELDDDYTDFQHRYNSRHQLEYKLISQLDVVFGAMAGFVENTPALCVAMSQGGDWIGGVHAPTVKRITLKRKAMNSFVCSIDKPLYFVGRVNDDVNTYLSLGARGELLFTTWQVMLTQLQTQSNAGGMTDFYLEMGTYVKSFYSVIAAPSCVKLGVLIDRSARVVNRRIHHSINWHNAAPMILREGVRKRRA